MEGNRVEGQLEIKLANPAKEFGKKSLAGLRLATVGAFGATLTGMMGLAITSGAIQYGNENPDNLIGILPLAYGLVWNGAALMFAGYSVFGLTHAAKNGYKATRALMGKQYAPEDLERI